MVCLQKMPFSAISPPIGLVGSRPPCLSPRCRKGVWTASKFYSINKQKSTSFGFVFAKRQVNLSMFLPNQINQPVFLQLSKKMFRFLTKPMGWDVLPCILIRQEGGIWLIQPSIIDRKSTRLN